MISRRAPPPRSGSQWSGAVPADVAPDGPVMAPHHPRNSPDSHHSSHVNDDWFDILRALLASDARFLVIGAHAMAVHGVPRGTQDLDVWVEPSPANAERVWRALAEFGAPLSSLGSPGGTSITPVPIIQLGLPPNRIDVLTAISGVPDFSAAWNARSVHEVRGHRVPFLGRAELIVNKRASGRRKDLADLEALGELPPSP